MLRPNAPTTSPGSRDEHGHDRHHNDAEDQQGEVFFYHRQVAEVPASVKDTTHNIAPVTLKAKRR
jgi:hypothetical protein